MEESRSQPLELGLKNGFDSSKRKSTAERTIETDSLHSALVVRGPFPPYSYFYTRQSDGRLLHVIHTSYRGLNSGRSLPGRVASRSARDQIGALRVLPNANTCCMYTLYTSTQYLLVGRINSNETRAIRSDLAPGLPRSALQAAAAAV